MRLLCPSTEKKDKILSAHNQIDAGNLLSNVNIYIFHSEASCAYTWYVQTTDTLEDDQPANQSICWGAAVDGRGMYYGIYVPTQWE